MFIVNIILNLVQLFYKFWVGWKIRFKKVNSRKHDEEDEMRKVGALLAICDAFGMDYNFVVNSSLVVNLFRFLFYGIIWVLKMILLLV